MTPTQIVLSIVGAVFASGGFWAFVTALWQKRTEKKSSLHRAVLGLLHDRIYGLCHTHIERGWLTADDYKNLMYLYGPYEKLGGNDVAKRLKQEVDKLPIREEN